MVLLQRGLEEAYQLYRLELREFFARRSGDPHAVDDLIQSMYVSLMRTRPPLELRDARRYLFGVAWKLLHEENRRLASEQFPLVRCAHDEFDSFADQSNRLWVEDDTSAELQQQELERALAQLPRVCQVAVLRQYRDNRSYKEIAQELGVTTHTVKKYIVRALNHLRLHFHSRDLGASHVRMR